MRKILLVLVLACVALLTACSYAADFVMVNASERPIMIQYKIIGSTAGPLVATEIPAIMEAAKLDTHGDQHWREVAPGDYALTQEGDTETVTIKLMPGEALRVTQLTDYGGHADPRPNIFAVQEISIDGAEGQMRLMGKDVVRKSFSEVSAALYILTYR